ncbi:MAG TPA: hypothetical protein VLS88_15660 [Polyangiales bacterium]|nr:hypothetical protein [Polyangiales bacterium]
MVFADEEEAAEIWTPRVDRSLPSKPNDVSDTIITGDARSGDMYEVKLDREEIRRLGELLTAAGANRHTYGDDGRTAEQGEDSVDDGFTTKGWSDGVDNRTYKGIVNGSVSHWPWRTIGQLKSNGRGEEADGHCTATFVGNQGDANRRYIITAAHCMWTFDGLYRDPDFWPRQDGCLDANGNPVSGCDQGPYGEWDGTWWMMPAYFPQNCVAAPYTNECEANDIAVMRMHRTSGASFPGAMGFVPASTAYLDSVAKYHRGYPDCDEPGFPANCRAKSLYGDYTLGVEERDVQNGVVRIYNHSSDMNGGHSGGPLYLYASNGWVQVFAVAVAEDCWGSFCTERFPNTARNITLAWYNDMVNWINWHEANP